jgi:hypothetical protein
MSVPDEKIVHYHLQRCAEDGLIALRLPELDVEAVCVVTDPSIRFLDLSHRTAFQIAFRD